MIKIEIKDVFRSDFYEIIESPVERFTYKYFKILKLHLYDFLDYCDSVSVDVYVDGVKRITGGAVHTETKRGKKFVHVYFAAPDSNRFFYKAIREKR